LDSLKASQKGDIVTITTYLQFDGLENPVALLDAGQLVPMISEVLACWPHAITTVHKSQPFVTIRPFDGQMWELALTDGQSAPRRWDAVNVICDLVAEMAWERLRSDPSLLCLHAAAAEFSGRLIVFPNTRRAGKSTLTAALARLGHEIYTDDFLPVRIDGHSQTYLGVANGVAPRVRLPLPTSFGNDFHDWVKRDPGPFNKQYKYLLSATIAPCGETMPIGAMVILDRQNDPVAPSITPISRADALSHLIAQNFARTQISGAILKSMDALTQDLPVFRMTYHCAESAAQFLAAHPALKSLPAVKNYTAGPSIEPAPLDKLTQIKPVFVSSCQYMQATGLTETRVDQDHFLADSNGLSIYRLNAGSVAIWNVLEQPANLDEVIEILTTAFEDVAPEQIAYDSAHLMQGLVETGLLVPMPAGAAAG
jgi:hypothetical protein